MIQDLHPRSKQRIDHRVTEAKPMLARKDFRSDALPPLPLYGKAG